MTKSYYYNFEDDLNAYPDAWCYVIFGGRNTGKTYSGLRTAKDNNIKFVYVKRTQKDIKLLCAGGSKKARDMGIKADFSPFVSLNRDFGWNVKSFSLDENIGTFNICDSKGFPIPEYDPVGYIAALSAVKNYKGFDMSYCDWIIFDEFVPKIFERNSRGEGDAILELYQTVSRDREHRGKPPLKLICFANADNAASPLTNTLEITDDIVKLQTRDEEIIYNERRGILIHKLHNSEEFDKKQKNAAIYKAMAGTKWAEMAFDNNFGYNDFTQVHDKINLKGAQPFCRFIHKRVMHFIWLNNETGCYLVTRSAFNQNTEMYDLSKEADQKRFFYEVVTELREASMDHRAVFSSYTIYNLCMNYKDEYKI